MVHTPSAGRTQRADARHNVDRAIEAAVACLCRDPGASVGEIARTAGLGRVTVYGHFPSRDDLVEAALVRVLRDGDGVLSELDLSDRPPAALHRLVGASWLLAARAGKILEAAREVLSEERIRELHGGHADRVEQLVRRGQDGKDFRDDLPMSWLTSVVYSLMNGAATDVAAGRLTEERASHYLTATVAAALRPT